MSQCDKSRPTPRTDREVLRLAFKESPGLRVVNADFARQLERELAALQDEVAAYLTKGTAVSSTRRMNDQALDAPMAVLEWIWHMDLHLTEHDERHAGLALRAAWPHVREYMLKLGEELGAVSAKVPSWIPVSERLPDPMTRTVVGFVTLVADKYGRVTQAEWDHNPVDGKLTCRWPQVTHWMPLPAGPQARADDTTK